MIELLESLSEGEIITLVGALTIALLIFAPKLDRWLHKNVYYRDLPDDFWDELGK